MKTVYLVSGWVVAGCAILSLILYIVAFRNLGADNIFQVIFEVAFLGITGTLALFYFANFLKVAKLLFIMAWVVAGLAVLDFIMVLIVASGTSLAAHIFFVIFTGLASTLILLRLSGKK